MIIACAAIACAIPAVASGANDPATNAAKFCKALASASGGKHSATYAAAVRTTFPNAQHVNDNNAYGKCVSWKTRENRHENKQAQSRGKKAAVRDCQAERNDPNFASSHNGQTFAQTYNAQNDNSAYGKCVSQKTKQNVQQSQQQEQQEDQNTVNAARQCRAERDQDRDAFQQNYG